MKEIKNRIAKVLSNYFSNNDVEITSSDIEQLATQIQYAKYARLDDDSVIYHIINITSEVDSIESNAEKPENSLDIIKEEITTIGTERENNRTERKIKKKR